MPTSSKNPESETPAAAASTAVPAMVPHVAATPVTDPAVLAQGREFAEAVRQTMPLAADGSREAGQAARFLRETTARTRGLNGDTARLQATRAGDLQRLISGPNNGGKAKEIIAALDYSDLQAGRDPGMVNAPQHLSPNVEEVRLSPDAACKRDILFRVRTKDGMLLTVPGGQVKTGSSRYVADSLVEMSKKPGYGRTGIVDARFVNPDGTPRVAPDAFTPSEAHRVRDAKVRLRGIRDLDARGDRLVRNIEAHGKDGLDPVARQELEQLRNDIARAYGAKGVAGRVAGGAAVAAATAAVVSLVVQYASTGKVDVAALKDASGKAAVLGGAGGLADAALYHAATKAGMAPEAAKAFAQQGVAAGFCLFAVGADAFAEIRSVRQGDATVADAVVGGALKAALDVLPLVMAPLGLAAIPLLVGGQLGGRWALAKVRESDRKIEFALVEARSAVDAMDGRIDEFCERSDEIDEIFARTMGPAEASTTQLRLVK